MRNVLRNPWVAVGASVALLVVGTTAWARTTGTELHLVGVAVQALCLWIASVCSGLTLRRWFGQHEDGRARSTSDESWRG